MSESPRNQGRSLGWLMSILIALLVAYYCFAFVVSGGLPPRWYERRGQRQKVLERVQAAGGWEPLRRECIALVQTNEMIRWFRGHTNDLNLPPVIMALQPDQVYYDSPKFLARDPGEPKFPVVRIKLFGAHSTGGHSIPYFGLEVVATSSNEVDYTPKPHRGASGNDHLNYRNVSEGVYEIF